MRWLLIGGAVIVLLLLLAIVSRGARYRRLFSDTHFLEVGRALVGLKQGALATIGSTDQPTVLSDPRVLLTSAGLAVVYTIGRSEGRYVHHLSISLAGGYTAHALGESFMLFAAERLGVAVERLHLGVAPSSVHHAELILDEAEHSAFAARAIEAPTPEEIAGFRRQRAPNQVRWERIVLPPS